MVEKNKSEELDEVLSSLRREVEVSAGLAPRTPGQFECLSEMIYSRTGVLLSPTTLKRIWNYLDESVTPRRSTLDSLARFCGWRDFFAFEQGGTPEIESGNVGGKVIRVGVNIRPGERIRLRWAPARVCEIEYIGEQKWTVVFSEGTRLSPGDTFACPLIVTGEPLYLDNLIHNENRPGVYVCGRKSGVTFEKM